MRRAVKFKISAELNAHVGSRVVVLNVSQRHELSVGRQTTLRDLFIENVRVIIEWLDRSCSWCSSCRNSW